MAGDSCPRTENPYSRASATPVRDVADTSRPTRARRLPAGVTVDLTLCKACGICRSICSRGVLVVDERGYPVVAQPNDCTVCFACEWHCPDFAIEVGYLDVPRRAPAREAL